MLEPVLPPIHPPINEGKRFYELYSALCSYANRSLKIVPGDLSDPEQARRLRSQRPSDHFLGRAL